MNKPRFVVKPTQGCRLRGCKSDDKWYFVIVASNGKVIATSEVYNRKKSCLDGIKAVQNAVPHALIVFDMSVEEEHEGRGE